MAYRIDFLKEKFQSATVSKLQYRARYLFNVTGAREAVRRVIFVVTVLVEPGFVPNVVVHVFVKVAAKQD